MRMKWMVNLRDSTCVYILLSILVGLTLISFRFWPLFVLVYFGHAIDGLRQDVDELKMRVDGLEKRREKDSGVV